MIVYLLFSLSFVFAYYCNYYAYWYYNTYMLQVKQSILIVKPSESYSSKTKNSTSLFYSSKMNQLSDKKCNKILQYPEYSHSVECYPHLL